MKNSHFLGLTPSPSASRSRSLLLAAAVGLVTFLCYVPTLEFGFLNWDDDVNVFENPRVQGLTAENLEWMFTDFGHAIRYKPLSWLGWGLVHAVFGLNPFGYHLANALLHSVNALLLFMLLRQLLGHVGRNNNWLCGLGALLWSLHPLRVEPVTWVTGMPYGLALAFMLGATILYLRSQGGEGDGRGRDYWLAVVLFALAILTYPIVLGFPALLVALDLYPLRRFERWDASARRALIGKIPFVLLSLAMIGLTVYGRFRFTDYWIKPAGMEDFGIVARAMQAFYVWGYYAWKPLLPLDLAPVYTMLIWNDPLDREFVLSAVGVMATSAAAFWHWRRWPALAALWFAHLGLLVPMLGLTERPHYPHDRYGIVNGVLWSLALVAIASRWNWRKIVPVGVLVVVLCGGASLVQQRHWRDDVTFFTHMAESLEPNEYRNLALMNLGEALTDRGEFTAAVDCFEQAANRDLPWVFPFDETRLALGHAQALISLARWDEALVQLRKAEQRLRNGPEARLNAVREAIDAVLRRAGESR